MTTRLRNAIQERGAAEQLISRVLREDYPKGALIKWERNGLVHSGTVLDHGGFDKIKIRSARTGAEYWLYADRIVA